MKILIAAMELLFAGCSDQLIAGVTGRTEAMVRPCPPARSQTRPGPRRADLLPAKTRENGTPTKR